MGITINIAFKGIVYTRFGHVGDGSKKKTLPSGYLT